MCRHHLDAVAASDLVSRIAEPFMPHSMDFFHDDDDSFYGDDDFPPYGFGGMFDSDDDDYGPYGPDLDDFLFGF